jgi:hypothetical protein
MAVDLLHFSGMLQLKTSSFLRRPDQLIQAININGDEVGSLTQRLGYTTYGGAIGASAINGLYTYPTTSTEYLFGYQNGNVIYNSGTWQTAQGGLLANAKPEFRVFLGQLFMVGSDGTTYLTTAVIDGTSYSTGGNVTNAPTGDSIELFNDQLWISKGSKIYPSSIPDVAGTTITWDTTNDYETVYTPNGESIITLHNNQALNKLLIFKTSTLHAWDGYRILDLGKVGTTSRRSVATVDNVTFFYNKYKNKIYAYTGSVTKGISRPIDKWLKGIVDKDNVFAIDEDNEFYKLNVGSVIVDGRTYANCEIRYAMLDNTFTIYSYYDDFNTYAKHNVSGVQRIYAGATSYVHQLAKTGDTVYSDNGQPINAEFMFETDFGNPANRKYVDKVMIYSTRAQNLKGRIKGRSENTWNTNFQINKDEMDVNVNPRDSRFLQFHFFSSSTAASFVFEGISVTPRLTTKRYG